MKKINSNTKVAERERVASLFRKGYKQHEIARIVGVSKWLVADVKQSIGMTRRRSPYSRRINTGGQLCWTCNKACGGCSWSDGTFTPVPGWGAEEVVMCPGSNPINTFKIFTCPLYEKEAIDESKLSIYEIAQISK